MTSIPVDDDHERIYNLYTLDEHLKGFFLTFEKNEIYVENQELNLKMYIKDINDFKLINNSYVLEEKDQKFELSLNLFNEFKKLF